MKHIYEIENIKNFVAFDLETTGMSTAYDGITQIGAVRVRNGVILEGEENRFNKMVYQGNGYGRRIPFFIEQLTGITNAMVASADPIDTVLRQLIDYVGDDILVGYNCFSFDCRFLDAACKYTGLRIENSFFDACNPAKRYIRSVDPHCRKYKLELISDMLGLTNEAAHNAFYDAEVTAKVLISLQSHPEIGCGTYGVCDTQNAKTGTRKSKAEDSMVDIPERDRALLARRESDDIDSIVKQLWENYPDGMLPASYAQLSRENDILIYHFRSSVKKTYHIALEEYLESCGFKQIPKKNT